MKKLLLLSVFLCALCGKGFSQNLTTVSAANITDINGAKLAAGQLCFLITDQSDNPISVSIGGGGQALKRGYCSPVAAGVVTSFTVPNPASTSPTGIYYRVTVKDSSTGQEVLRYTLVSFTGATFNFDNYAPMNLAAGAPLVGTSVTGNLSVTGNVAATGTVTGSNIPVQIDSGTGTTNTIPKYTNGASGIIGNSSISDNGTTVSTAEAVTAASLNLASTGVLSTTAQSGTGSLCMTTNCVMTTPNVGAATGTSVTFTSSQNVFSANKASGSDIFAQANAAAATASSSGTLPATVIINPGSYSTVTTTLNCVSGVTFLMQGVKVSYSGAGKAINCANVQDAGIVGPMQLIGPGTAGVTIGIQLGIGSGGSGVVTTYNYLHDIHIRNFNKCLVGDGSPANNGTYTNNITAISADSCNIGFFLVPTAANFFNANNFDKTIAIGNVSDGYKIDGANGNGFTNSRAELNGGKGWNFAGTQATQYNSIVHSWNEANTGGDFFSGSGINVAQNAIIGGIAISTPIFGGTWTGQGNILAIPGTRSDLYVGSGTIGWHINSTIGAPNFGMAWVNDEGVPSFTNIIGVNRTGAGSGNGAGNLFIGTPEYPVTFRSNLASFTNCSVNSVSPAACGSAMTGAFVVPTTTTSYTVNTTAVTTASRIFLTPRTNTGDLPGTPTCVAPASNSTGVISGQTAGTGFTFSLASTAGQTCWNYWIFN